MIIKAQRVSTRSGTTRTVKHIFEGSENETISVLRGTRADVVDMHTDAKTASAKYCVRHWIVSPHETMTRDQLFWVVAQLAAEYGFDPQAAVIVEHRKQRAVQDAFDTHWHVLAPEVDGVSGRILKSSWDYAFNELLARYAEHHCQHQFVHGAHSKAVLAELRKRKLEQVANAFGAFLGAGFASSRESFTHAQHQETKRRGVDLPALRARLRELRKERVGKSELIEFLSKLGLRITKGKKKDRWIIRTDSGDDVGSLGRLFGMRVSELREFMHGEEIGTKYEHSERRPDLKRGPRTQIVVSKTEGRTGGRRTGNSSAGRTSRSSKTDPQRVSGDPQRTGAATRKGRTASERASLTISLGNLLSGRKEQIDLLCAEAFPLSLTAFERVHFELSQRIEDAENLANAKSLARHESTYLTNANRALEAITKRVTGQAEAVRNIQAQLDNLPSPRWWWVFVGKKSAHDRQMTELSSELAENAALLSDFRRNLKQANAELARAQRCAENEYNQRHQAFVLQRREAMESLPVLKQALVLLRQVPEKSSAGVSYYYDQAKSALEQHETDASDGCYQGYEPELTPA